MDKHAIIAIFLSIVTVIDSAKILAVFPTPSISHHFVFRPLTRELIKRGHEVVVITPEPAYSPGEAPMNLTEIDVHNVSYPVWQKSTAAANYAKCNDIYKHVKSLTKVFTDIFEIQIKTEPIKNMIKNKDYTRFDLLLIETCVRPALTFSHIYKAPVISISSLGPTLGTYRFLGVPNHPLLYPTFSNQRLYNLTYWEKVKELFYHYSVDRLISSHEIEQNKMFKKHFGPDIPTLTELYNNIDMFFQNTKPITMDNPPVPATVVSMGGIHQIPPKPLPEELVTYLNNSKTGVIYVSFGTNVKSSLLPPEKIQMMIKVFSTLPYDILWKMDTKTLSGTSKNIKSSEWLPQADLLRHKKIKAFITQGGQQSTDEAINAGVPLIGIPTFGDQWFNVEKYVQHKIGIKLDWTTLTEEEFRNAILTVAEDASYRINIRKLCKILNDQPQSPLERVIFWIEHVLKHGGAKHLRAPAANMSWTEYYEVELVVTVVIILIVALYFSLLLLKAMSYKIFKFLKMYKAKLL